MMKLKKHLLFLYLIVSILLISVLAGQFILAPSDKIYQYIPAESDIVIEINAINFVKEVTHQWVYEPKHFLDENQDVVRKDLISDIRSTGINPVAKVLIFNEKWADESLWFSVIKINNATKFTAYLEVNFPKAIVTFNKSESIALVQISQSINQEQVSNHVNNILARKIQSIESNIQIKQNFLNDHEINIYLKSLKSDYISDGYLSVNFNDSQIDFAGFFHPIGNTDVKSVAYQLEPNIGISLRSSLNLLNTIYLFNNSKLEYLPDYNQIAFDYDGVKLITNDDVIPVTSFPNINLLLDIADEKTWLQYLDANIEDKSLLVTNDTIMMNSEIKAKIRYRIANQKFELFQKPKSLTRTEPANKNYFNLAIHPEQIIDKMVFSEDKNNPPKTFAKQLIRVIKSVLGNFTYLKAIDEINFRIDKDDKTNNFVSTGHLIYHNQDSHSTIASYYLFRNFIQTLSIVLG